MKKKVLIIGMSSIVGGVETYLMNLFENIDKNKFQIDFLVQKGFNGIFKEKILKLKGKIFEVDNFKRHPIKSYKFLRKFYKEEKYDVIHINLCNASGILYAYPSKKVNKNIKIITHSHNSNDRHKFQHYCLRPLLNKITTIKVACSNLAATWMFGKKHLNNCTVLNNAIKVDKFLYNEKIRKNIRKELNLTDNFVIGHVGRFSWQKNHKFLIEIFNEVYKKNKNSRLLLVGTGELMDDIKLQVNGLGLNDAVIFMGVCDNTNELYQAMDLFVMPSLFEGLPIVGVEAQTSGLNCIFSENVSKQVSITKHTKFLPLNNKDIWLDEILSNEKKYSRNDVLDDIRKNGYDLKEEIKKIERLYLK